MKPKKVQFFNKVKSAASQKASGAVEKAYKLTELKNNAPQVEHKPSEQLAEKNRQTFF